MNDTNPDNNNPDNWPSKAKWLMQRPKPGNFPAAQMTLHDTCETYGFREQTYTPEIRDWVRDYHEKQRQKHEEANKLANRQTWLQKLCPEHLQGEQE